MNRSSSVPGLKAIAEPASDPAPAIRVSGLVKEFRHHATDGPRTFRHWVESGFRSAHSAGRFRALDDVSFEVFSGEMLGVIGRNGSGKSTLLRLLGGVMSPNRGRVELSAAVTGILELNAGMHPDLSGRENIVINAVLSGLLRREAEAIVEAVIDFAEIREHIDEPVRTYSAGMRLRLGFAVAVHVEPRIVLIDEVLAVGDLAFQRKCLDRIRAFKAAGAAIVLISHDIDQVAEFCDRVLWLQRGRVRALGPAAEVTRRYRDDMMSRTAALTATDRAHRALPGGGELVPGENWLGSQEASIAAVTLRGLEDRSGSGEGGGIVEAIHPGDPLGIELLIGPGTQGLFHAAVSLADPAGRTIFDSNTERDDVELGEVRPGDRLRLELGRIDLAPGEYRLTVGLWARDWSHAYDMHRGAYVLRIAGQALEGPRFAPPRRWRSEPAAQPAAHSPGARA
ncbi:ABC transporter ATP-binding protein [Frigidibacter sp. MR17.14]|uniref:ABC transporter ATP-binding protein n=1 Tax=Frigidibacter sp. MR17.14 TaxID=3126509 RepID=UPI003012CA00